MLPIPGIAPSRSPVVQMPPLAAAGITLWVWFEMALFGGFEENVDISVTALLLMLPSCLAGAYAGFLRSSRGPM